MRTLIWILLCSLIGIGNGHVLGSVWEAQGLSLLDQGVLTIAVLIALVTSLAITHSILFPLRSQS